MNNIHYGTLLANLCRAIDCPIYKSKKLELRKRTKRPEIPHGNIHWSFCYDDRCTIHYDAKYGAGYFPQERKRLEKGRISRLKN